MVFSRLLAGQRKLMYFPKCDLEMIRIFKRKSILKVSESSGT